MCEKILMNPNNEQNGSQPPLPGQPPPSVENGTSSDKPAICRDYIWGTCNKNKQCKYRHELDFQTMRKVLKFCHDYQNPSGCTRELCTYLHTTKEEEALFFKEGRIPYVLAQRHDTITMGPPPPPPQPSVPVQPPFARMPTMMQIVQLPPPPPPPPTQASVTLHPPTTPIYTAPPPASAPTTYVHNSPPPSVLLFDASKPPPFIPTSCVQTKNGTLKRNIIDDAGPSNKRKADDSKVADTHCELCRQSNNRIEAYKEEINKLSRDEEYKMLVFKEKFQEYKKRKAILRSLVSFELVLFDDDLDEVPQLDVLTRMNQQSFLTSMTERRQTTDLIELFKNSRSTLRDSMSDVDKSYGSRGNGYHRIANGQVETATAGISGQASTAAAASYPAVTSAAPVAAYTPAPPYQPTMPPPPTKCYASAYTPTSTTPSQPTSYEQGSGAATQAGRGAGASTAWYPYGGRAPEQYHYYHASQ